MEKAKSETGPSRLTVSIYKAMVVWYTLLSCPGGGNKKQEAEMSLRVRKTDGGEVEVSFIGLFPVEGVRIGEHEMSLEHFSAMANHFLGGGFFGWRNNETPEAVNNALSNLFELYERVDGKWVWKEKYRVAV